ncbi:MAG: hypothetical protein ACPGNT_11085, partial [Rhodospirillales bacterium]
MKFFKKFLKAVFSLERMLGFALLIGLLGINVVDPYPMQFVRAKVFDFYQRTKPREIPAPEAKPVTIIDLD